jgi:hypothetical protein
MSLKQLFAIAGIVLGVIVCCIAVFAPIHGPQGTAFFVAGLGIGAASAAHLVP